MNRKKEIENIVWGEGIREITEAEKIILIQRNSFLIDIFPRIPF